MAVELFRDGEKIRVEPEQISEHLKAGWSFDESGDQPEEIQEEENEETEQKARAGESPPGPVTNRLIREKAREAGIVLWKTATIKTLRRGLGWDE